MVKTFFNVENQLSPTLELYTHYKKRPYIIFICPLGPLISVKVFFQHAQNVILFYYLHIEITCEIGILPSLR